MMAKLANMRDKRQIESLILVFLLVATAVVIFIPMSAPPARGVVFHNLTSTADEDNTAFDINPALGIVEWAYDDHSIQVHDYEVTSGYTLILPSLDYAGNPATGYEITFMVPGARMNVTGSLITRADINPYDYTGFVTPAAVTEPWDGIYFYPGSFGNIEEVWIEDATNGIVFMSGSNTNGTINNTVITNIGNNTGLKLDHTLGHTDITNCMFQAIKNKGIPVEISGTSASIKYTNINSHGPGLYSIHIENSTVLVDNVFIDAGGIPGAGIYIEGYDFSDTTIANSSLVNGGFLGALVFVEGNASHLIKDCVLDTSMGCDSVYANETWVSAHPVVLNPTMWGAPGDRDNTFDNTTLNATGGSSVTLQWYMDVYLEDPDTNAIQWGTVNVSDPSTPDEQQTDPVGWARDFRVTEFIQYDGSQTNFNPFNVSGENNSMFGYASPEVNMNMSKAITIGVPFPPQSNTIVSWIQTPAGTQEGYVDIDYILEDPDAFDDGFLRIDVYYCIGIGGLWIPATQGPGGDPITNLDNNTQYTFQWDTFTDLGLVYNTTLYIKIIPWDTVGIGTDLDTGNFTVDNIVPVINLPPGVISISNTTATIQWTADEACTATVWYGLDGTFTDEVTGSTGSSLQTVILSGLKPGRNYTYIVNSTDPAGHKNSSDPTNYTFETEVHIQLYKGWNMISIPPNIPDPTLTMVLSPIAGQYDAVQAYNSFDTDPWEHNRPGKTFGNDLTMIVPSMGLWIHMKNDAVFIPDHNVPATGSIPMPTIVGPGWNFVGYPSAETRPIATALTTISGSYDMVMTYDETSGQWLRYDPAPGPDDLTVMEMGKGYWIHCTITDTWTVDYV